MNFISQFKGGRLLKKKIEDPGRILTPKDIQEDLQLSKNTVYKLIRMSSFPKIKIGNSYRIPENQYKEWISLNLHREIVV